MNYYIKLADEFSGSFQFCLESATAKQSRKKAAKKSEKKPENIKSNDTEIK